ncbi:MAG: hypothetical protein AB7S48_14055 [Bacteroidales bacterium]
METNFSNQADQEISNQKIRIKQYAYGSIKKRTYGLIAMAILIAIALIVTLVYQRKILVLKKTLYTPIHAETLTTEKFEGYKTIVSIASFEILSDKFSRVDGVESVESHPLKHKIIIKHNTSTTKREDLLKTLYTKAKLPISYPSCSQSQITTLRLWISEYYDSYDGLIIRNMISPIQGIYYLESGFEHKPYIDLIINKDLDIKTLIKKIESSKGSIMDKDILKEIDVNYRVIDCSTISQTIPIDSVRSNIFSTAKNESKYSGTERADSLILTIDKYKIVGGIRLRQLISDKIITDYNIVSYNIIPDSLPLLKVVFLPKSENDKEKLFEELNRPIISLSKFRNREIKNSFHFKHTK